MHLTVLTALNSLCGGSGRGDDGIDQECPIVRFEQTRRAHSTASVSEVDADLFSSRMYKQVTQNDSERTKSAQRTCNYISRSCLSFRSHFAMDGGSSPTARLISTER
jgi:hypothetical protein